MSKSNRHKDEVLRFAAMAEGDLLELRQVLHREVKLLVQEKDRKTGTIKRISTELGKRQSDSTDRVVVTDHAVVRYLERREGLDLEGVRQKIAAMARRAIRENDEFMRDPISGMIIVKREGSDSVATVMDAEAVKRPDTPGEG